MDKLLSFLDGKKAIIGTILLAINTYLISAGIVDNLLGSLIATIITVLTGVAVQQTTAKLGRSVRLK